MILDYRYFYLFLKSYRQGPLSKDLPLFYNKLTYVCVCVCVCVYVYTLHFFVYHKWSCNDMLWWFSR